MTHVNQEKRIYRPADAARFLGISKPTLYRLIKNGELPPLIKISDRASGIQEETLIVFLDSRRK